MEESGGQNYDYQVSPGEQQYRRGVIRRPKANVALS